MGFLKDSMDDKEPDQEEQDASSLELTYQRLFMKIGRDFVHVDDFVSVIEEILQIVDPNNQYKVEPRENASAMTTAAVYKQMLEDGNSSDMVVHDLIILDEED